MKTNKLILLGLIWLIVRDFLLRRFVLNLR